MRQEKNRSTVFFTKTYQQSVRFASWIMTEDSDTRRGGANDDRPDSVSSFTVELHLFDNCMTL